MSVVDIVIISYNGLLVPQAVESLEFRMNNVDTNIIVQQAKQSIPLNVNAGFERVNTDWWVLFNDDWEALDDGWLDKLLQFGESDPEIGFVSCRIMFDDGTLNHAGYFISENGIAGNKKRGKPDTMLPDDYLRYAHPILIRSDMFRELGGYDSDTFKGSQYADIDFVYRVGKSPWKIFFAGSVRLLHHYRMNKTTNAVKERVRYENETMFRAKHGFKKQKGYLKKKQVHKRKRK